jgi:hypothetical protein
VPSLVDFIDNPDKGGELTGSSPPPLLSIDAAVAVVVAVGTGGLVYVVDTSVGLITACTAAASDPATTSVPVTSLSKTHI